MGNLCGKPLKSDNDPFAQPGRVLGSAAPATARGRNGAAPTAGARTSGKATLPAKKTTSSGPGRPLGGGSSGDNDPRTKARLAAEQRANTSKSQPKGKLGEQLDAQKKQTRTNTLEEVSRETRGIRDADANAEARRWN